MKEKRPQLKKMAAAIECLRDANNALYWTLWLLEYQKYCIGPDLCKSSLFVFCICNWIWIEAEGKSLLQCSKVFLLLNNTYWGGHPISFDSLVSVVWRLDFPTIQRHITSQWSLQETTSFLCQSTTFLSEVTRVFLHNEKLYVLSLLSGLHHKTKVGL